MTILDQKLLDILVCPVSKKPLEYDKEANELISNEAGLAYPVKDGIPVMLPEEARKLYKKAPVAQLDRVLGYEPRGREFESLRARHSL